MRRNPILSESDAFALTVTVAVLVVIGGFVGWLATPIAGVVVFVVLAMVGLIAYLRRPEPGRRLPLRNAAHASHPHGAMPGSRHVIVVANEALAGEELSRYIQGLDGRRVEVDVLAPILTSRTHLAYTDIDSERDQARERLVRSLAWAREHGFLAYGKIGDASPTTALEDELRNFGADQVIVVTSQSEPTRWQEGTELQRLRDELEIPVIHMPVAQKGSTKIGSCSA
jgi:hypothetical protein